MAFTIDRIDNSNIRINQGLVYLIQQQTKLSSAQILGFFSDLAGDIIKIGAEYMVEKGTRSMKKKLEDFFPGTDIPFSIEVDGSRWHYSGLDIPNSYALTCTTMVGFSTGTDYQEIKKIEEAVMETMLLGADSLPLFERPKTKTPKLYKDLMEQIRKKRMI